MFLDMSGGNFGDIPSSKSARQQVPGIGALPYAFDQLVTRGGRQVFNMPLESDRPLDKDERDITEREGLCIGCHRHYGSPLWEKIREKYGRARTSEEHQEILEKALKRLAEPD